MHTRLFFGNPRLLALVTGCTAALASAPLHAQVQIVPDDSPAAPAAPVVPPAPQPAPTASPKKPYGVLVRISSDHPLTELYRQVSELRVLGGGFVALDQWESICWAPCDTVVDPRRPFQVRGRGITRSGEFELPVNSGEVLLRVKTGSSSQRTMGIVLAALGGGLAGLGGLTLLGTWPFASIERTQSAAIGGFVAGGVMIGAGIAMMIPGIWYALKNRTVVWTDVGGWLAARPGNVLRF